MSTLDSIYKQHTENTEWLSKLHFFNDELAIMKGRLEEIAAKNSHPDCLKEVEHFQNQFIVQKENIDNLLHDVKMNEFQLEDEVNRNPIAVDHRKVKSHTIEKHGVESLDKVFSELRDDFNRFATKWM